MGDSREGMGAKVIPRAAAHADNRKGTCAKPGLRRQVNSLSVSILLVSDDQNPGEGIAKPGGDFGGSRLPDAVLKDWSAEFLAQDQGEDLNRQFDL